MQRKLIDHKLCLETESRQSREHSNFKEVLRLISIGVIMAVMTRSVDIQVYGMQSEIFSNKRNALIERHSEN